jgi:hypothetical protein
MSHIDLRALKLTIRKKGGTFFLPCRYFIDKERRLVISTGWDDVTAEEMQAHQDQLLNDPDLNPEFNQIIDARKVTAVEASSQEIRRLARRNPFSTTSRRAVVATLPAVFGVARMLSSYHELSQKPSQIYCFYDLPSALRWLGFDERSFQLIA